MLPAVGAFSVISAGVIFLYLALSAFLEIFFTLPEADFITHTGENETEYLELETVTELVMGSYTQEDGTEQESHKGAAYIKDDRNIIFADKGSTIHFTAALTGISQENYNTAYSVRTYAVLQRPDGSTFTIYNNETVTATVYDIAVLAYNATGDKDGYAESADVREYLFTNIIDKADFEKFPNDGFKVK